MNFSPEKSRLSVIKGTTRYGYYVAQTQSRRKNLPYPLAGGGELALLKGLMLRMEKFFSSFLMFQNICEDIRA